MYSTQAFKCPYDQYRYRQKHGRVEIHLRQWDQIDRPRICRARFLVPRVHILTLYVMGGSSINYSFNVTWDYHFIGHDVCPKNNMHFRKLGGQIESKPRSRSVLSCNKWKIQTHPICRKIESLVELNVVAFVPCRAISHFSDGELIPQHNRVKKS